MKRLLMLAIAITATTVHAQASTDQLNTLLNATADSITPRLPLKIDADVELMGLMVSGHTMTYTYNMYPYTFDEISPDFITGIFSDLFITQTCAMNGTKMLIDKGAILNFDYVSNDGFEVGRITIDSKVCKNN